MPPNKGHCKVHIEVESHMLSASGAGRQPGVSAEFVAGMCERSHTGRHTATG